MLDRGRSHRDRAPVDRLYRSGCGLAVLGAATGHPFRRWIPRALALEEAHGREIVPAHRAVPEAVRHAGHAEDRPVTAGLGLEAARQLIAPPPPASACADP